MKHQRKVPERRNDSNKSLCENKSPMTRSQSRFNAQHYGFGEAFDAAMSSNVNTKECTPSFMQEEEADH